MVMTTISRQGIPLVTSENIDFKTWNGTKGEQYPTLITATVPAGETWQLITASACSYGQSEANFGYITDCTLKIDDVAVTTIQDTITSESFGRMATLFFEQPILAYPDEVVTLDATIGYSGNYNIYGHARIIYIKL